MDQSTPVLDIDFGMSQLSGNKTLLFTLLGKFTEEYRSIDADIQKHVEKGEFTEAYSLVHTLKGVTGNLGLFALHHASKPIESSLRNDQCISDDYPAFIACVDETMAVVDALTAEPDTNSAENAPVNNAAAEQAKTQLLAALKASEFISQERLDSWLASLSLPNDKQAAIVDAVDELDYEAAITELENS